MSRLRALTAAATLVALSGTAAAAGACILPFSEPALVSVQTTVLGSSSIRHELRTDGSTLTTVHAPAGRWDLVHTGVVVAPELDGTFTVTFPCDTVEAAHVSLTPDGDLVFTQSGAGWSFTLTARLARHAVVPAGECAARVVGR